MTELHQLTHNAKLSRNAKAVVRNFRLSRAHAERSKRGKHPRARTGPAIPQKYLKITLDRWIASDYSQYIATSDMEQEMYLEQRIAEMGINEAFWFDTLASASARAFHGDARGVPLRDLSDAELERVFGPCASPVILIAAVTAWRESGRSFVDFMSLIFAPPVGEAI